MGQLLDDARHAIRSDRADALRRLLDAGCDPNGPGRLAPGSRLLHIAARVPSAQCVDVLIAAGADINARTWSNNTPLHSAAIRGAPDAMLSLLRAGADPRACNDDGQSVLDLVRAYRDPESRAHCEALITAALCARVIEPPAGDRAGNEGVSPCL